MISSREPSTTPSRSIVAHLRIEASCRTIDSKICAIGFVAHFGDGLESSQEILNDWHVQCGELLPGHISIHSNCNIYKRQIRHLIKGYAMLIEQWAQTCLRFRLQLKQCAEMVTISRSFGFRDQSEKQGFP